MLATIRDDTWNVLNMQHIIPNSKRWDYPNIPSGIFEVKLTFEMLTVRGQQHSFSTHERVFLWKCQSFWVVAINRLKDPPTWLKMDTTLEKPPKPITSSSPKATIFYDIFLVTWNKGTWSTKYIQSKRNFKKILFLQLVTLWNNTSVSSVLAAFKCFISQQINNIFSGMIYSLYTAWYLVGGRQGSRASAAVHLKRFLVWLPPSTLATMCHLANSRWRAWCPNNS